ncbi:hypothetical protein F4678DRAFT_481234 [Xylaria arbuscula]|nr:hypothetical protein F4678DRAFT_481234 [Xylaria arbuscula]
MLHPLLPDVDHSLAQPGSGIITNAWELAVAGCQLQAQLKKGTLPADDSITSRVKRSSYCAKVVDFLRESNKDAWLLRDRPPDLREFSKSVKKADVNMTIRNELRDHFKKEQPSRQLAVALNIISNFAAANPVPEHDAQRFYLTIVNYKPALEYHFVKYEIQASSFTISHDEGDSNDAVTLNIHFFNTFFKLNELVWEQTRAEAGDLIKVGRPIFNEVSLDLFLYDQPRPV